MIVVDVGNTSIKWAFANPDGSLGTASRFENPRDAEQLGSRLQEVWGAEPRPGKVVIGSVAGSDIHQAMVRWVHRAWQVDASVVHACARGWGVTSAYREPAKLGVDRWAALVAARRRARGEVVVVDSGTATTVDVLDETGQHLGGVIAPGLALMKQLLVENTGGIASGEAGSAVGLARTTADAVHAGAVLSICGLVEKLVEQRARAAGRVPALLLTGGQATVIADQLALAAELSENLVLEGLAIMGSTAP